MRYFTNLFWYRTLCVLDRFHPERANQTVSTTCMTNTYGCVYSTRLLMMDSKPRLKYVDFFTEINL